MARYDRIARIPPPERGDCFPGWLTLRDLEGREREPELGRRARLRFLALRPVQRLLLRGLDGPDPESLRLQVQGVRDELERLDSRDPERARLLEYLAEVGGRSPVGLVTATLDVGAAAESAGHSYAAEEFYRTGLDLARKHDLPAHRIRALRRIARVCRGRGEWEAAASMGRAAATLADEVGEPVQWAMALAEVARAEDGQGRRDAARTVLREVLERGESQDNDHVRAVAAAGTSLMELAAGNLDAALREGATAIELFPMTDPHRNATLLNTAAALRRLGLWSAAEACYRVVETRSTWVEHRAEAATERAAIAAERGDIAAFRQIREGLLAIVDSGDLRLGALLHLGLGRGCLIAGELDDAREHLRQAIGSARDADLDALLRRAGELLEVLETGGRLPDVRTPRPPTSASRSIAERIQQRFGAEVVAAG